MRQIIFMKGFTPLEVQRHRRYDFYRKAQPPYDSVRVRTNPSLRLLTGFTIVELLVTVSIISLLSSVVLASLNSARTKSYTARAQQDLAEFRKAIALLEFDTNQAPNHHPIAGLPGSCQQDAETYLDETRAGIQATDGAFPRWAGPYLQSVPKDPWGNRYIFDPDYRCFNNEVGCGSGDYWARVVHSGGPNKSGINAYEADNIVLVLCRP